MAPTLAPKWTQTWHQNGPKPVTKMDPILAQNGSNTDTKMYPNLSQKCTQPWHQNGSNLGTKMTPTMAAKWTQTWRQNVTNTDTKMVAYSVKKRNIPYIQPGSNHARENGRPGDDDEVCPGVMRRHQKEYTTNRSGPVDSKQGTCLRRIRTGPVDSKPGTCLHRIISGPVDSKPGTCLRCIKFCHFDITQNPNSTNGHENHPKHTSLTLFGAAVVENKLGHTILQTNVAATTSNAHQLPPTPITPRHDNANRFLSRLLDKANAFSTPAEAVFGDRIRKIAPCF